MQSFHVTVEFQEDGAYCRLGLFQAEPNGKVLAALMDAGGRQKLAGRGLPRDAAFETWLSLQQPSKDGFSAADIPRLRIARLVGFEYENLTRPRFGVHHLTHLDAAELGALLRRTKANEASWKALLALVEKLPAGRIVCWLQD